MIEVKEYLSFDDVLLRPKYSTIKSRSEIDLSVNLTKGVNLRHCIVPANMTDIVNYSVMSRMYDLGAMSLMHRFCSFNDQITIIEQLVNRHGKDIFNYIGMSIGVKEEDKNNLTKFSDFGIKIVCIDIAHLDSILGMEMIQYIADKYPHMLLIAGNVATKEAAARAWKAGADIVKVGIGSSGICSTRLEAGAGVPQLSAIEEIHFTRLELEKQMNKKLFFISDGGCRKSADCIKALCYADMIMLGGMLAGTESSPGKEIEVDGELYKSYQGSSTHKPNRIEGVKGLVKTKGSFNEVIQKITEGIQSGCSYQNCRNLQELKEDPTFIKITSAGQVESSIHDVVVVK